MIFSRQVDKGRVDKLKIGADKEQADEQYSLLGSR